MKKRNIIIIAVLVIALIVAAVLIFAKPDAQPESADKPESTSEIKTFEPTATPETQTIIIDKDKEITATIGVEAIDEEIEDELPSETPGSSGKPDKPANSPKPEATPTPTPTPTPTDAPLPEKSGTLKYEEFYALSPEQMDAYKDSFGSMDEFYNWLVAAQEQFTKEHPDMEMGPDGSIDLSKLQK